MKLAAKNVQKITVLTQITQLFPHMREVLIISTGILDNSRIFPVYPKKGIFFPRLRQKKWPFLCMHKKKSIFWPPEINKIVCDKEKTLFLIVPLLLCSGIKIHTRKINFFPLVVQYTITRNWITLIPPSRKPGKLLSEVFSLSRNQNNSFYTQSSLIQRNQRTSTDYFSFTNYRYSNKLKNVSKKNIFFLDMKMMQSKIDLPLSWTIISNWLNCEMSNH